MLYQLSYRGNPLTPSILPEKGPFVK
jgi:hypothetical protein